MKYITKEFEGLYAAIKQHPENGAFTKKGWEPIFSASVHSRIVIIGQAPGLAAQESQIPWNDQSGKTLRQWMGVTEEVFYNPELIALIPMDFYFPGKKGSGDAPPRKDFAGLWHAQILDRMPEVQLTLLVGAYAQDCYLKGIAKRNLTENVRSHEEFLDKGLFPIVHPSPLAGRWRAQNPWFEKEVLPALKREIDTALGEC